jgi:hypothetical protein
MTDLPQLQTLLIDAARRRRRTRRVRRGAVRALVALAVVALAVWAIPQVGREGPDRELPASPPTPSPTVAGTATPRAADFYSVLKRPATHDDAVRGLFEARRLAQLGHATAWLVPRRGAVCLVLQFQDSNVSVCRHNVADVRYPLVAALPGRPDRGEPQRVIAAVFPDTAKNISVFPSVRSARSGNALIIGEGDIAQYLRWQTSSDSPPRTLSFPPGGRFVLHAREESPASIPPEAG